MHAGGRDQGGAHAAQQQEVGVRGERGATEGPTGTQKKCEGHKGNDVPGVSPPHPVQQDKHRERHGAQAHERRNGEHEPLAVVHGGDEVHHDRDAEDREGLDRKQPEGLHTEVRPDVSWQLPLLARPPPPGEHAHQRAHAPSCQCASAPRSRQPPLRLGRGLLGPLCLWLRLPRDRRCSYLRPVCFGLRLCQNLWLGLTLHTGLLDVRHGRAWTKRR
mmetsp:Transcript_36045/g.107733  ORF Transcript_36045/g.107733 Transcript_36045/m.107733 type:complete len:217 (+) Transcript_36045:452-1102(+)